MPAKPPPGPTQHQIGSDEEFEQVAGNSAESGFLCVVEVFASWCGATDAAVSTISRLNADFSGRKLRFYQVNADRVAALERFKAKSKPKAKSKSRAQKLKTTFERSKRKGEGQTQASVTDSPPARRVGPHAPEAFPPGVG